MLASSKQGGRDHRIKSGANQRKALVGFYALYCNSIDTGVKELNTGKVSAGL